jgi:hypothetical protein
MQSVDSLRYLAVSCHGAPRSCLGCILIELRSNPRATERAHIPPPPPEILSLFFPCELTVQNSVPIPPLCQLPPKLSKSPSVCMTDFAEPHGAPDD